eukprot:XP_014768000.1 PREDICTED: uncharacterized protein LOC106867595 [Octopus bimaculoides]
MTSYHPASNGMVKWFHCQLKALLRAYPDSNQLCEFLSVVLLGCRSSVKEDLGYSPAELLYGSPLSLPGQMLALVDLLTQDPSSYVHRLQTYFSDLPPMSFRHQTVLAALPGDDSVRGPLIQSYKGPYHVLGKMSKAFSIDINGSKQTVSFDGGKASFF